MWIDPKRYNIRIPRVTLTDTIFEPQYDCFLPESFRIVTPESPLADRKAAEQLAWYFKREFGYDFVQYTAKEKTDPRDRVILLIGADFSSDGVLINYAIGAVCVRWREWTDAEPGYALAWVWFHPFVRRKGWLSRLWPYMMDRFPGLFIEPPLSLAMDAFLKKVGYSGWYGNYGD